MIGVDNQSMIYNQTLTWAQTHAIFCDTHRNISIEIYSKMELFLRQAFEHAY